MDKLLTQIMPVFWLPWNMKSAKPGN